MNVPFFADELFRYVHFEAQNEAVDEQVAKGDAVVQGKKGQGWDRKIAYSMKEYRSLLDKVRGMKKRLSGEEGEEVSAEEIEMVAYVLRRGAGRSDEGSTKKEKAETGKRTGEGSAPSAASGKRAPQSGHERAEAGEQQGSVETKDNRRSKRRKVGP